MEYMSGGKAAAMRSKSVGGRYRLSTHTEVSALLDPNNSKQLRFQAVISPANSVAQ